MGKPLCSWRMSVDGTNARVLLIDTCGATGSVALAQGEAVVAETTMPGRAASAELLARVRELLGRCGWTVDSLQAIGVVSGPGSFTGVRVGLSAAKGLCEALGVPMAAVSRLEVMADRARERSVLAVLDAGRGEVYVRDGKAELLLNMGALVERFAERPMIVTEEALAAKLAGKNVERMELSAASALPVVRRTLASGQSDVALTDANYVRGESEIYASKSQAAKP